jgi:nitrite reductase (NADH) large subunit
MISRSRITIVVIGNGMVGQRFCEKLVEFDVHRQFRMVTFCEEPRAAYDRVGLTSFFAHRDAEKLLLQRLDWYRTNGIELYLGDRASSVDRRRKQISSQKGVTIDYEVAVFATGSYPFVPPVPGMNKAGVFVYRTLADLENIILYARRARRCAVIGGGLLGLEAAKAALDLGLETHVVEFSGRLMPRQIDDAGSRILVKRVESMGVRIHLNKSTKAVHGTNGVERLEFTDGESLDVDMIIVSAGIRPRDDLAKECGLTVGERGGIQVDDRLLTSDPAIHAIGECALHRNMVYGLVAPGYEMAEVVAANLTGGDRLFLGADLSTKLKLLGCDVASFGEHDAPADRATAIVFEDPIDCIYQKLLVSHDGTRLLGGVLVGDASAYGSLRAQMQSQDPLTCSPGALLIGQRGCGGAGSVIDRLPGDAQVCSCHNVSKEMICSAIRQRQLDSVAAVKQCTRAGTGCGGCLPLVNDLFQAELKQAGKTLVSRLCEHFPLTRTELFAVIKIRGLKTFAHVLAHCGTGAGCEICKPAVASILASLWNENVLDDAHVALQDTNDRFLANIQRGGLYSVVPRVPGGEITPQKLAVIAQVAEDFGLYTKITGGQRIDMFGARVQDLPDIWQRLVDAGFESGHAYGKALRTVKSCVGTTWCRYGVRDSVGFAIVVENRYKGIRAPHKIKMAVSGCVRECAEAQGKDVGLVATENGYNLYVCGNGGARPRHADLLATDLDEQTAIRYIDRFLMYYISTADRLTRTSVWCEKLEGGIDHIRDVVVYDKLGLAAELEAMMQRLVDSYECEWSAVVRDPIKRRQFRQFVNSDEGESSIEIVTERGQQHPEFWPSESISLEQFRALQPQSSGPSNGLETDTDAKMPVDGTTWVRVGAVTDFPADGGAAVKYGLVQIAVFNFASRGEWFASQNMCPHRKAFVLSSGIVGDAKGVPKIACPMHKKTFSLQTGESLEGEEYRIRTFPARVEGGDIFVQLPPMETLNRELATEIGCRLATSCATGCLNHHVHQLL